MLVEIFEQSVFVRAFSDLEYGHTLTIVETAPEADLHRRFSLIARKHPYLYASKAELLNAVGHIILQKVLNSRDTDEIQINFDFLAPASIEVHALTVFDRPHAESQCS